MRDPMLALRNAMFPALQVLPWPALLLDEAGCVVCANPAMENRGVASGSGRSLRELLPEYAAALRGDPPRHAQEAVVTRKTGEETVHERLWLRPTLAGALLIVTDETRRHQLETENAQTVRLASLGFLLAGVSHEISNPLSAIYSMLQLVKNDALQSPQMLRKGLDSISANVQRVLEIARKLNSFARVDAQSRRPAAVDEVIEEALILVRHEPWFNEVAIEHHKDPAALVLCHAGELQQVFFNVLGNAVQAMEGNGRILITTRRIESRRVEVMIQDDGPGIRPEHIGKLFQPFFSTKPAGQNTGLGLTISDELVREHDGVMRAESTYGKGARFYVELPLWSRAR